MKRCAVPLGLALTTPGRTPLARGHALGLWPRGSQRLRALLAAATLASAVCAWADPGAVDGAVLGLDESALPQRFADAYRLARPLLGPHGLRGAWQLPATLRAGLPFDTIFYLRGRQVQRIEQRWLATGSSCGEHYASLSASLDAQFGPHTGAVPEVAQTSTTWASAEYSVAALQTQVGGRCALLVLFEPRLDRDASAL